mmetsp:Transcript_10883/g.19215  ORF Transcript_10883/g.19215 Transcript_10883/m.19215 type:complete len:600 (+) Transcript_10883:279-2078(+)
MGGGKRTIDPELVGGEWEQAHLLDAVADDPEMLEALLAQLTKLDASYPGGLGKYISNAKSLLKASKEGKNPFEGLVPSVPIGERLQAATAQFEECEAIGLKEAGHTGFILVAGGLGERLGYHGAKVSIPAEILTNKCFLQNFCESILALQARARRDSGNNGIVLPLAIMTSGDTHQITEELLHKHTNFGMEEGQITLLQQQQVPAMLDDQGRFAINPKTGLVATKPHGHGDVHSLVFQAGLLDTWKEEFDVKWVLFFQDTNTLVFRAVTAALGVSASKDFDINSLTVPRKPGEAVGGICQLDSVDNSQSLTVNVEYNQLDPLLRATSSPEGDVADETGFSPYPGNINVLVFKLSTYASTLKETGGAIPEFVNPKYADKERTVFLKPTRLECMMQDFPKLLVHNPNAKVGFTQMERFMCFSAMKNNPADALAKLKVTGVAESPSTCESDLYSTNRLVLAMAGVQINTANFKSVAYLGIPFQNGAKVVLSQSFGITLRDIRNRFPDPEAVKISDRSSLVLEGDVTIESLDLDGDLRVVAAPGASIVIKHLTVKNDGVEFLPVAFEDQDFDEVYRIRGYTKKEHESLVISQTEPGETIIDRP